MSPKRKSPARAPRITKTVRKASPGASTRPAPQRPKTAAARMAKTAAVGKRRATASRPSASTPPVLSVVGIGASAGGLDAMTRLLRELRPGTGRAFVIVQHLAPDHESVLPQLLAAVSSIPVVQAKEGAELRRDTVYVIPPNVTMTVRRGHLHLAPRSDGDARHAPIDSFLASLAAEVGERAIGVVLSGTASDGTTGMREIRAAGGIAVRHGAARRPSPDRKFAAMMGREAQELLGRDIYDFLQSEALAPEFPPLKRRLRLLNLDEVCLRRADGSVFWASMSASQMLNATSQFSGVLQMYTDISERKQLQQQRDDLVRRLVSAQEDERGRVARELHDQLGQHLVGLSLGLSRLANITSPEGEAAELIQRLCRLSDEMARDAHHLAMELRPAALDDLGLVTAVSNYADDLRQRFEIEVDIHCEVGSRLPPAIETTVYRIVQEALTNVVKHARARHASIILKLADSSMRAIVEDDGVGFSLRRSAVARQREGRLGLAGMEERAALVGGQLQIESRPGHGTTLFLSIPVSPSENRGSDEEAPPAARGRPRRRA